MKKMTYKKGLCPDAYTLLGLLCLRTNEQLNEMKKAYKEKYETELEEDVGQDFAEEFRSLIFGIIYAGRDESPEVDLELVQEDIDNLQGCDGGAGGTKEEHFQACLEERSWIHLRRLFNSYKDVAGETMESFIGKSEVYSDVMKESYITVVKIIRNEADFYAERLRESIEGIGTDDETLISTIVLRSEIDLVDIIMKYEVIYGTSLEDDVIGDTSGDYKNLLLKLLTVPEEEEEDEQVFCEKAVKKKVPGVEICTQTDVVEHEEVVPMDVPPEDTIVNAADEGVEEAVGHEVEHEEEVKVAVEEVVEEEKVEVVEESVPEEGEGEDEKVPQDEEQIEQEEVVEEEQVTEVKDEEDPEKAEGETEEEGTPVEEVVEGEEQAPTTIEQVDVDEAPEEKKTEEVDNADGG